MPRTVPTTNPRPAARAIIALLVVALLALAGTLVSTASADAAAPKRAGKARGAAHGKPASRRCVVKRIKATRTRRARTVRRCAAAPVRRPSTTTSRPTAPTHAPESTPVATTTPTATTPGTAPPAGSPVATEPDVGVYPLRPKAGRLRIGLNANTQAWGGGTGSEQALAKRTGAGWLREEFLWSTIQPSAGVWDWSRYDRVVGEAATRGMRVLPLLHDVPAWAGATGTTVPNDPTAYAEYVARVVARYGAGGTFWATRPALAEFAPTHFEIWNEPFIAPFAANDVDAGRYARLVRAAVTAGRAANPAAKFLIAAETTSTNDWVTYKPWIDAMYEAVPNLGDYFDAIAAHPYGARAPDVYTPERSSRWQVRRLEEILATFARHGDGDKPMWITEIGWSVCPTHKDCVTEAQQAEYFTRLFEMVRSDYRESVEAVFIYGWHDLGTGVPSDKEQWFGIIRKDGSTKPAWDALRRITGVA